MNHESKPTPEVPPETVVTRAAPRSLESLMAEYVQRAEAGQRPDPGSYLNGYPEYANELRSFFRNHHWLAARPAAECGSLVGGAIGPYEIEAEIARGGMGVVYRARQSGLKRPVALKLITSGVMASEEERRRFRIEAKAAAQLDHPGIIEIHEIGSWRGYDYFSMALVTGDTLQAVVNAPTLDAQRVARLVRDVSRAVAYAHRRGIVHRDLKPDNILICDDDRPLVTDFGLAKWHEGGTVITQTGQVLGTPHYMSPEQARGRGENDATTDIYSLGAILYALLTGRPPHVGGSAAEVLRSVLQDEPANPRRLRADVPPDLEKICLQAIRHDPGQRYATADALADDLDRFLAGESPRAANSGLMDRVAREIRRDQHQDTFADWGRTLITLGVVIFAAHLAMQLFAAVETGDWLRYWGPRSAMLLVIFLVVYRARGGAMFPQSVAERPIWSIWLGYLATLGVMNMLLWQGAIDRWMLFALASALSGFGFLAMAGHVWGGSALVGAGFFAVTFLIAAIPSLAPVLLGLAWLAGLYVLGRHYQGHRLGSADRPVSPALAAHPAQPSRRSDSNDRTNQNR